MTTAATVLRRFLTARPIHIDKAVIRRLVEGTLVPQLKSWLKRHPHPDKPIGSSNSSALAEGSFYVDSVDRSEQIRIDVEVVSISATGKAFPVLGGGAGKRKFEEGEAHAQVTLWLNGGLSPNEYLATNGENRDLSKYVTDRFQPLGGCTSEACVPYGLYSILIHETTHVAESMFRKKLQYEYDENKKVKDQGKYVNDPAEVKAFMQQIVDETVGSGTKLQEHFRGNPRKLIDMSLRMSTTWKLIEKNLTARNRNVILSAVYSAFSEEGLV
jgi:hypothetical protein